MGDLDWRDDVPPLSPDDYGASHEDAEPLQGRLSQSAGPSHAAVMATPSGDAQWLSFKRRPIIQHADYELPKIVDMACTEAVKASAPIYARGTTLVSPVTLHCVTPSRGVRRSESATVLVPVDEPALVEALTSVIDWRRYDGRKGDWKPVSCPPVIAKTIISRRGDWPFPQLNAVISAPTMRPDGTILDVPGFDVDTGILFATELAWPKTPDRPSLHDAKKAFSVLSDLIGSFPFVAKSDLSAAVAMILTALVRPRLPSAPMFGVSAPTPGTGKSKLVDIASILATGQAASVLSAAREEEELRKHIGSTLMAGDAFVTLDNIEFPLRSEFLCQVLTQTSVTVRVLGESRNMKLPTSATFCATGNSLRFAGDLTRRVVLINLDANMERPEDRVFDTDATAVARVRRVEFVTAALTVLRAFVVQRGPKVVPSLGGFEDWSNLVRSAVMWVRGSKYRPQCRSRRRSLRQSGSRQAERKARSVRLPLCASRNSSWL